MYASRDILPWEEWEKGYTQQDNIKLIINNNL